MSWVIEEILTSTTGFVIAMVVLSVIIGVGLYGYWVYANHVTLENYLWPIAEVLPYKGSYFLAIVNTGNEPFYVKQIYLKGGTVLTPNQAVNPSLSWCSTSNTKLVHNQWWCGEVNQLPVAVRVCSALDPSVCVVAPVHGWTTVTFSQPSQAAFGISNCPVLVSVSDSQNAGWEVTWTMASGTYSVSESTSYQWCILPPYYPITIDFQSTITNSPSGYACQISPQSTQVNYNGTPTTVPFTVTCQQQQQPPPPQPPPPSPSPPGGNNGGSAVVDTVIDAPSSVSWTVNLYFNSQLEQTYQGSGSQSYTWDAPYGASGEVSYQASAPNTCSVSYSPSQSFTISPGNSYTETITITCQGQQPPPPPMCYFSYSYGTNPPGLNNYIQFGGPSSLNPGDSGTFGGSAALTAVDSQGDKYQFQYWSVSSNPSGYAWSGTTDQADFSAPLSCPSTLTSSVTVQITGTAVYQFIGCKSYSVSITLTTSGKATLSWSWCPLDPAVSWSASGGSSGNAIYANGQVTSELGVTSGKSSQQVPVCGNETAVYQGVNPSGGSINNQASGSVTFQVQFYCKSNNVN
jgi:hypothetical protein